MNEIFKEMNRTLFSSALAEDGKYIDESQNVHSVRLIPRDAAADYSSQYPAEMTVLKKTVQMLRPDTADIKIGEWIEVSNVRYEIDAIISDDLSVIELSVR